MVLCYHLAMLYHLDDIVRDTDKSSKNVHDRNDQKPNLYVHDTGTGMFSQDSVRKDHPHRTLAVQP